MIKKLINAVRETLVSYKKIDLLHSRERNDYKHPKVNLGAIQAGMNAGKANLDSLSEVEFQVFSQFGDDGIIQYLIGKLPVKNKTFIEFGVENYREANTRFLLFNNNWSGMVMDGSMSNIESIRSEDMYTFFDLRAVQHFITRENINDLLNSSGFDPELGILSIDIDGNDYWVWKEIKDWRPDIIICEYNSLFGFEHAYTIPYKHDFVRGGGNPLNFYGTSLKAAYLLAKEKGYFFIGCNSAGNNAYFIREDHRSACPIKEKTVQEGYNFAKFTESWHADKTPKRGKEKIQSIDGMGVYDVEMDQLTNIHAESIIRSLTSSGKFNGIHRN